MRNHLIGVFFCLNLCFGLPVVAAEQPSPTQTKPTSRDQSTVAMTLPKNILVPEFWGGVLPGEKKDFSILKVFETFDGDIQVVYTNKDEAYPYSLKIFSFRQNKIVKDWPQWKEKKENEKFDQAYTDYMQQNRKVVFNNVYEIKLVNGYELSHPRATDINYCYNFMNYIIVSDQKRYAIQSKSLTFLYEKPVLRKTDCVSLEEDLGITEVHVKTRTPYVEFYPLPDETYLVWDVEYATLVRFYGLLQSPLPTKDVSWVVTDRDSIFDFYYDIAQEMRAIFGTTPQFLEVADNVVYHYLKLLKRTSSESQPK